MTRQAATCWTLSALCIAALGCNKPAGQEPAQSTSAATTDEHAHHHEHHQAEQHEHHHDHAAAEGAEGHVHGAHHEPLKADTPLPGMSLYNLQAQLTNQRGEPLALASLRGDPVLVAMFYASCTSICPMLIAHLQAVEAALPEAARAQTKVLLVTLDPARDSVESLAEVEKRHTVDGSRWSIVRTSEASVQEIAAVLGVRYRRMPDGEVNHSPTVALLDRQGVIAKQVDVPQRDASELSKALVAILDGAAPAAAPTP